MIRNKSKQAIDALKPAIEALKSSQKAPSSGARSKTIEEETFLEGAAGNVLKAHQTRAQLKEVVDDFKNFDPSAEISRPTKDVLDNLQKSRGKYVSDEAVFKPEHLYPERGTFVQSDLRVSSAAKRPTPINVELNRYKPIKHEIKYNEKAAEIQLRSYGQMDLDFFTDFLMRAAFYLKIPAQDTALRTRIERWTVIKSPFVLAKVKENFERRTHRRLITLYDADPSVVQVFLATLSKYAMEGVGARASVYVDEEPVDIKTWKSTYESEKKRQIREKNIRDLKSAVLDARSKIRWLNLKVDEKEYSEKMKFMKMECERLEALLTKENEKLEVKDEELKVKLGGVESEKVEMEAEKRDFEEMMVQEAEAEAQEAVAQEVEAEAQGVQEAGAQETETQEAEVQNAEVSQTEAERIDVEESEVQTAKIEESEIQIAETEELEAQTAEVPQTEAQDQTTKDLEAQQQEAQEQTMQKSDVKEVEVQNIQTASNIQDKTDEIEKAAEIAEQTVEAMKKSKRAPRKTKKAADDAAELVEGVETAANETTEAIIETAETATKKPRKTARKTKKEVDETSEAAQETTETVKKPRKTTRKTKKAVDEATETAQETPELTLEEVTGTSTSEAAQEETAETGSSKAPKKTRRKSKKIETAESEQASNDLDANEPLVNTQEEQTILESDKKTEKTEEEK